MIGIGINVDQTADELPVPTATSLALAGQPGRPHRALRRGGASPAVLAGRASPARRTTFMNQYRGRSATLDRDVRVDAPGRPDVVEGRVGRHRRRTAGWSSSTADGPLTLSAGDVVHVRPAE